MGGRNPRLRFGPREDVVDPLEGAAESVGAVDAPGRSGAGGTVVDDDPIGHLAHAAAWGEGQDGYIYAVANGGCGAGTIENAPTVFYRALSR